MSTSIGQLRNPNQELQNLDTSQVRESHRLQGSAIRLAASAAPMTSPELPATHSQLRIAHSPVVQRLSDYIELTKPRIAALELVVVTAAACMAGLDPTILFHTLIGTLLVAASASALNQWRERLVDLQMERTASRPLPSGRLAQRQVIAFGLATVVLGFGYLAVAVNSLTAGLGLLTWVLYVLIYTPLKSHSPANTFVGAISGALPALMGWTAIGAPLGLEAATLFLILFLWQFPHFMAIAWIYRRQYETAGLKMLTVVDPSGLRAGAQAVIAALALIPISLVPALSPMADSVGIYTFWVLLLGLGQFACAAAFLILRTDQAARWLLQASLLYLPALLVLLILVSPI